MRNLSSVDLEGWSPRFTWLRSHRGEGGAWVSNRPDFLRCKLESASNDLIGTGATKSPYKASY
jgi:hypothetical protein